MKSFIISSNGSGKGKTTVTLGILKAFKDMGYKVQSYKVGPDYIDGNFHQHITGVRARNLDLYLMGEDGIKASFSRGHGDIGIIEGVMGLYDGKGISSEYSTAHVAKVLNLPVVLVLSPKAKVATICAEINGLMNFEHVNIAGIILNNINESYYNLLKLSIEKYCYTDVLGYVPKNQELILKSRHLGLVQSIEIEDLDKKIELCSQLVKKHVNMDKLFNIGVNPGNYKDDFHLDNQGLKIAVAYDKAFNFYYRENIELLEELGEVQYFSPLKDKEIPKNVDFLYLGGGYPEVFIDELSQNKTMLNSIKVSLEAGTKCYAECGGLMYLSESIEGKPTVGFLNGKSYMTERLQNFGYAKINVVKENSVISKGTSINCHEFHKSSVELNENTIYQVEKDKYDGSVKQWKCGYQKKMTIATYAHVHFFGNLGMLRELTKR
ncbi:cobyrinate a,c-diamide synthase [Clostridium akagii]|uniref:cobyrinate a,c-diamide synthase n=1 Tax=Clostridium akagii TaxID=91623 RepID=UPI00047D7BEA|nr:cobyrinate a,c-diamide synthase [Clostridium akagii]